MPLEHIVYHDDDDGNDDYDNDDDDNDGEQRLKRVQDDNDDDCYTDGDDDDDRVHVSNPCRLITFTFIICLSQNTVVRIHLFFFNSPSTHVL